MNYVKVNNIRCRVQVIKILFVQFIYVCYFLLLRVKYSPQYAVLQLSLLHRDQVT